MNFTQMQSTAAMEVPHIGPPEVGDPEALMSELQHIYSKLSVDVDPDDDDEEGEQDDPKDEDYVDNAPRRTRSSAKKTSSKKKSGRKYMTFAARQTKALIQYIQTCSSRGFTRDQIRLAILNMGFTDKMIGQTMVELNKILESGKSQFSDQTLNVIEKLSASHQESSIRQYQLQCESADFMTLVSEKEKIKSQIQLLKAQIEAFEDNLELVDVYLEIKTPQSQQEIAMELHTILHHEQGVRFQQMNSQRFSIASLLNPNP